MPELLSDDEEPLDGELPLVPELLDVSLLVPDALLPLVPDPLDELSVFGVSTVVVVVVTVPESLLPEVEPAPDEEAPVLDGSLVVVVVVDCPNVNVAVPISDKKIAIGNFFMLAPRLVGFERPRKVRN